jgi:DNA-binding NarL/FixJ family response regulator
MPWKIKLSEREVEICTLVSKGHDNQEIGKRLGICESTVKTHLKNIYLKLDVKDRTRLVIKILN